MVNPPINTVPVAPETCIDGVVKVDLLTDVIRSRASFTPWDQSAGKVLRYEIGLECEGQRVGLKDLSVAFDINAIINPFATDIDYRIVDKNNNILSTSYLESIDGEDLFGNTGTYAHWLSNSIDIQTNDISVIIEFDLSPLEITPINQLGSILPPSEIETFIRIGNIVSGVVTLPFIDDSGIDI